MGLALFAGAIYSLHGKVAVRHLIPGGWMIEQRLIAFFDRHASKLAIALCFPLVTWGYGWEIGLGSTLLLALALALSGGDNGGEGEADER